MGRVEIFLRGMYCKCAQAYRHQNALDIVEERVDGTLVPALWVAGFDFHLQMQ